MVDGRSRISFFDSNEIGGKPSVEYCGGAGYLTVEAAVVVLVIDSGDSTPGLFEIHLEYCNPVVNALKWFK